MQIGNCIEVFIVLFSSISGTCCFRILLLLEWRGEHDKIKLFSMHIKNFVFIKLVTNNIMYCVLYRFFSSLGMEIPM